MKLWTNNKFKGFHPVVTAAVVVADNATDAADFLSIFLEARGLEPAKVEDMEEMIFVEGQVRILCDGDC